jgi:EAL domain-containing protein (putative c-di-GMP-specific phosphodiesterase class I)
LKNADIAMYHAKKRSSRFEFYTEKLGAEISRRAALETDLRNALSRDEFELYYQPQANVKTGQITGVEALIRWNHPRRGLVMPNEFIGVAEETGLILEIGAWVLHTGCLQIKEWERAGLPLLRLAVNISTRQFRDPELVAMISTALSETRLPAQMLNLEITESTAMDDVDLAIGTLTELRALGMGTSIDDFGTGYSSLAYIKNLPVNEIKIDRSFLSGATTQPEDRAIVQTAVQLARSLNLSSVGEGVETEEQLALLREIGCHMFQGSLLARPLPAHELGKVLKRGTASHAENAAAPRTVAPSDAPASA